jgi:hypothetical protein
MADKKISALTGATTPLAGTEVLPIVQSGATVKVAVSDLTAGRAVSATQLTSTIATGTAPLVVTSTTNVANLNASSLNGATFAAPGAIGGGTAAAGNFTTLGATGVVTQTGANPSYYAKANNNGIASYFTTNAAGVDHWRMYSAMGAAGQQSTFSIRDVPGGLNILDLNPTGASINGTLSATGVVTFSNYGAGSATFNGSGVISSVSDETWKIKDGVPADPDAMIKKLEPGYWYYNDEKKETFGTARQLGFYAQNVNAAIGSEAAPEPETYIVKDKDGVETTATKPWGYYDRSVLAVTVMSLQKALATIESLTARITALENK